MSILFADTLKNQSGNGPTTLHKQNAAKAWLQFNQTTPAIIGSLNISSVSDDSSGIYTPSLTNAVSSTSNCVISGMSGHNLGAAEPRMMNLRYDHLGSFTTSAHTLATPNGGNATVYSDIKFNMSLVHGDLA